jgi:hypothetical protein
MSTNIHFVAGRKITFKKKNGKRGGEIQTIYFNVWQTPTRITREITASADPMQAYKDWILTECSRDEEFPVYDDADIFGEGEPIGKKIYNAGKEHVAQFEEWLKMCDEEGYTVVAEAW